jgi:hypothetical protein
VTIQELGSLGELIAAIATMATLVYLALRIRGSAAATRAEARRSMDADSNGTIRRIAGGPEISQLFPVGLANPEELTPENAFRFRLLMSHFFTLQDTAWKEVRLGTISRQELDEHFERSRPFPESPGGRAWWQESRGIYPHDFQEFFESKIPNRA